MLVVLIICLSMRSVNDALKTQEVSICCSRMNPVSCYRQY